MLSRYAQVRPASTRRRRAGVASRDEQGTHTPPPPESAGEPSGLEDDSRFRAAALRPVVEPGEPVRRERRTRPPAGSEKKALRLFDRALLAAEVISALIVIWLVGQYIYTAYIDTAPRRLTPARIPSPAAPSLAIAPTATPTLTPTHIVEVAPPLQGEPGSERAAQPTLTPTATAEPTPTVEPALLLPARLPIPVMFLDSVVHEVTVNMGEWEVSPLDVGHHEGTANPGEVGNVVLAAHRDINSALFRELDRLQPGDEVFVSNSLQEYRYIVTESFVVSPQQTEVMAPTDDRRLTLITCTPIGLSTQRLIVTAVLDEEPGTR
jgi:sortase A